MAIQVLDGISHIRLKSAMWVGETSDATHLLNEVLDNSLDEVISSHADSLTIDISSDSTVTVSDNGRGIPTDDHLGEPLPVVICTAMFSSGKFDNDMYNLHIGLHGVGLTAVNALSEFLEITTDDGKKNLFVRFEDSKLVDQTIIDSTGITGTTVKFKPSSQYFDNPVINTSFLEDRLDITMAVCKNLKITYNGNILKQLDLKDLIEKPKTKGLYIIRSSAKIGENSVEVLFTYGDDRKSKAYVNLLPCSTGTHLSLTESSISKIWLDIIGKDKVWSGDTLRGLHTVISVFLENPSFSAQIKTSLTNKKSELTDLFNLLRENLSKALDKHPDMVSLMSAKMIEYRSMLTRIDSDSYVQQILDKGVVDQDGNVKRMTKNQRLIECSSTHRDTTQLYIVEGASAAGSLIKSRDEKLHAVFPLRGKITNVVDMGMDDVFKSAEIKDLINAIGTQVGKWEDIANLRYGKILITADADPDGKSIENLLIGLFAYLLPKTLKAGYVYIVEAPLYKQGNNYFYDESQLDKRKPFGRFKGLGEMDFVEAEETLIKNPRLIQVIVNSDDDLNYVKSLVRSSKYKRDLLIDKKMLVGH